ncbi:MAG: tetratricopeptide repeat protein [Nanoarchaeota archaeon]|nr:tetratricopeptide repeat protein [Nanoarchaeota archaeon]MBU1004537.1 tetratricopeptide repeat protein [Nanoarchaeota archaeon]MBU1945926.1 tetratricopeptide repeat protein [Nanoarchaeota archaeon]
MRNILKDKRTKHILLIIALTILVYSNSFGNYFVYDDHSHILENKDIRYLSNIPKFFTSSFVGIYRPIRSVAYMITYSIWRDNPFGYHLNNLLFHISITILIYLITLLLTEKKDIAFISSLLFGIHPIHTERVTNITGGFDLIGIFFIFLSFYLWILYSKKKENKFYILSIISFIIALFSSEEAIILPLAIILYEACFNKNNLKKELKKYSVFFAIGLLFVWLRFSILKIGARADEYIAGNLYLTLLTMAKVIINYLYLLILPIDLTLYHNITIAKSWIDTGIITSIALIISLILIAISCYKKKEMITFIIGWFFITLIPFYNILPLQTMMAERYLYIPSFAFCLLIALAAHRSYNLNRNIKIAAMLAIILLVISYSATTIKRNTDWKDDLTLWTSTVKTSPSSTEAHDNLGFAYERAGQTDKSIYEFKQSIKLDPSNYKAYTNLGIAYAKKENFTLAEAYLKTATKLNPGWHKAYNYLGIIYATQGLFEESIVEFKKAIASNPDFDETYFNLGAIYEHIGETNLAKKEFEKALELNPSDKTYIKKLK